MNETSTPSAGRKLYLENIPREEALARLLEKAGPAASLPAEEVRVPEALGRVTAVPIFAALSSPHFHAAAMDGYALRSEATVGASAVRPLRLKVDAEAHPVDTGDPLPSGTDAVVMAEHVHEAEPGVIQIEAAVPPWTHVRVAGEDMVEGQLLLPPGHRLRPFDLGGLLAAGVTRVSARRQPRVAIIPTGDELVPAGQTPRPGELIEFNSVVISACIAEWGGEPIAWPIVEDQLEAIEAAVKEALERADIVLVNAGSSAGREDYTSTIVQRLGELFVHGVAIFPGKPTVMGACRAASGAVKPVLGIPGYPVSAAIALQEFVRPLMAHLEGTVPAEEETVEAVLSRKSASHLGMEEFVRVKLGEVGGRMVALPAKRGASVISSLIESDGVIRVPPNAEGVEAGERVRVELFRPRAEVRGNILMAGSHDNALDLLASELRRRFRGVSLSASAVGSMAGLIAVRNGEAHLAGSHLLDPATGEYNWSYIRRYLKGREVVVVNFVHREQGIMVPPGNPRGISSVEDFAREGVTIANRQLGAGTRVLLDHLLAKAAVEPSRVRGYDRVETTHVAVAMAVAAGRADAGLGIRAAAKLLGLDFVPLGRERFDFVIPAEHWETGPMRKLMDILRDAAFAQSVRELGGYGTELTGRALDPPARAEEG
ncbi:MAG: molybdopterin biosynthesis protein [Candidatus Tectomicrobia bacterium RIFCSPLOWO2_12_FULL_69_37]|nr:MAG: molybdopterin biosynthesis protein [Candidatus Tectomicrobia bacterium RIFCSPLOWO2_02_FULL_70_19]OGL64655.1 MAG: molybdopterin biosynthesis protein [Candidatus Tectomicrobia bacterium RIFCSPLOWO2_12_FULL_69_37]